MTLNQLLFPFLFLPLGMLLFAVTPRRFKQYALLVLSLAFIAWGNLTDLAVILLASAFAYVSCLEISHFRREGDDRRAKIVLISAVTASVLLLGYFKYFNFVFGTAGSLLRVSLPKNTMAPPVGVSFFTFSLLSAMFDVYRGKAEITKRPLDFLLFVTFFPKLGSGPIIQYADMAAQMRELKISRENTEAGLRMFIVGLSKKTLLAGALGFTFNAVSALETSSLSMLTAWLGALSYTFMLYYDFSGYSDMAIGLGKVFGFTLPQNFKYPYRADSVSDFWRRWHISLGAWFRDYVYIPLGGNREGTVKTVRNLLVVWLLTGLWHGANWTFILWGLYYGALIVLDKFALGPYFKRLPVILRRVIVFFLAVFGWVFFFSPDLASAFRYLGRMFAFGSFADGTALYYLGAAWGPILIGAIGSQPLVRSAALRLKKQKRGWFYVVSTAVFALLLALCIAAMVSDTYSSFLYAQF